MILIGRNGRMSVITSIHNYARNVLDFVRDQNERFFRIILFLPSRNTRRSRVRQMLLDINTVTAYNHWQEYQDQPRREIVLDNVLRFVHFPIVRAKEYFIDPVTRRVGMWYTLKVALPRAREFTITSYHRHYIGYHNEVECYLRFGNRALSFSIYNADWANAIADEAWLQGESGEPHDYGNKFSLVVPAGEFNNEIITQAIKNWYMDRYYWKYRHWSHRSGTLPAFTNEVAWEAAPKNLQSTEQSRPAIHGYLERRGNEMKAVYGEAPRV